MIACLPKACNEWNVRILAQRQASCPPLFRLLALFFGVVISGLEPELFATVCTEIERSATLALPIECADGPDLSPSLHGLSSIRWPHILQKFCCIEIDAYASISAWMIRRYPRSPACAQVFAGLPVHSPRRMKRSCAHSASVQRNSPSSRYSLAPESSPREVSARLSLWTAQA